MNATHDAARRRALWQASGLALLLGAPQLARGAGIVAVRVWPAPDYTRVTLESDQALSASHFTLDGPPRLVVDVQGLQLDPQLKDLVAKVKPDDPYIAGVRVAQNSPDVVRIVFDLKQAVKPQVFALKPVAAYRWRLVFDLYPTTLDPLLALVDKLQRERSQPASSERVGGGQSLDDWIARSQLDTGPSAPPPELRQAPPPRNRYHMRSVLLALDPGHGGEDPGATGPGGTHEKDVVLLIGHALRELAMNTPNMRVIMTRDSDFFVPLWRRVSKAQRANADLFASIHADGWTSPDAHGASVFCLSAHGASSIEARLMAQRENAADAVGGTDIHSRDFQVAKVMLDMATQAQIDASLKMAQPTLRQLANLTHLHAPRVQQAGFVVLKSPSVPSMLVETGFITNPDEEARLQDPQYRNKLAAAIFDGIRAYLATDPPLARNRG